MNGQLDEISFNTLKERKLSDQCELGEFSGSETTYIAPVSLPRRGIEDISDEVMPELGMPEWALRKFLDKRAGYYTNSAIEDAHNEAYQEMNLEAIYYKHIKHNPDAKRGMSEIIKRLMSGENITLVCYEEAGDMCHRHLLIKHIIERIERLESSKFKLTP